MKWTIFIVATLMLTSMAMAATTQECTDSNFVTDCSLEWHGWNLAVECETATGSTCTAGDDVYTTSEADAIADDLYNAIEEVDDELASLEDTVIRIDDKLANLWHKYKSLERELDHFKKHTYRDIERLEKRFNMLSFRVWRLEDRVGSLEDYAESLDERLALEESKGHGGGISSTRAAAICREEAGIMYDDRIMQLEEEITFLKTVVYEMHKIDKRTMPMFFDSVKSYMSGEPVSGDGYRCYGYMGGFFGYCILK